MRYSRVPDKRDRLNKSHRSSMQMTQKVTLQKIFGEVMNGKSIIDSSIL